MSGVRVEKSCSRSSYIAPVIQGAGKQTEEQDKRHMPVFLCGMFLEAATQSNLDPIHQNLVIATYSCKRAARTCSPYFQQCVLKTYTSCWEWKIGGQRSACDAVITLVMIFSNHICLPENVLITKELEELEATGQENQHTLRPGSKVSSVWSVGSSVHLIR